jgi:hypothetical protein
LPILDRRHLLVPFFAAGLTGTYIFAQLEQWTLDRLIPVRIFQTQLGYELGLA